MGKSEELAAPDSRSLPDRETILKAAAATVFDENGKKVAFGTLFEDQKTILVFIRHFFCCACQAYVSELAQVPPAALEGVGVKLVVVGCGDWQPIKMYKQNTSFPYEIYADPTRNLYRILDLKAELIFNTPGEEPAKYLEGHSIPRRILSTTINILRHPTIGLTWKGGDMKQLGGDFIFGPGIQCEFASKMRSTADHVEIDQLMKAATVEV